MLAEDGGELGEEGDLAHGGARLRSDAAGRDAAAPGGSWWRTWTTPAAKSTSPQLSASTSEKRMPVAIAVASSGR